MYGMHASARYPLSCLYAPRYCHLRHCQLVHLVCKQTCDVKLGVISIIFRSYAVSRLAGMGSSSVNRSISAPRSYIAE